PIDGDDVRHVVYFGPLKKHVMEAVMLISAFDFGFTFFFVLGFLLMPNYYWMLGLLTVLVPEISTLIAKQNGKKTYALVSLLFSGVFIVLWTAIIVETLWDAPGVYADIESVIERTTPCDGELTSPFIRTLMVGVFHAAVEALIYYNLKVHYALYRFVKEQEEAKRNAARNMAATNPSIPAAYQGSYQGYDPQPPLVQK
ncbi:hypothetical protein PENTCL1PPCAC_30873, partial [Pristionchus entomophagus]